MRLRQAFLSIVFLAVTAACPEPKKEDPPPPEGPQRGGQLTAAFLEQTQTLDPVKDTNQLAISLKKALFDGLLDYDSGSTLVPRLAEDLPTVDATGKVYTFKLVQGVKFHNGREVTAEDVAYSITRVLNPATQSPGADFLTSIEGASAYMAGTATSVSGIKVIDKYTIQFTLTAPDVSFLHVFALDYVSVVLPKEEVEKPNFGRNPVGTGAFKFVSWEGDTIRLAKNPDYFYKGLPYLDELVVNHVTSTTDRLALIESGDLDFAPEITELEWDKIRNDSAWEDRTELQPEIGVYFWAFNNTVAPFNNKSVRQAIAHALNKSKSVEKLKGLAVVTNQLLPPLMPGHDSSFTGFSYNPDQAKTLLASAGYSASNRLAITVHCPNIDSIPLLCESYKEDLAAVNVDMTVNVVEWATWRADRSSGNYQIGMSKWIADYPDPDFFFAPVLKCNAGSNYARYCNAAADALRDQAISQNDRGQRLETYRQLYRMVMDEVPWLPLFNRLRTSVHSDRMHAEPAFAHPEHYYLFETMWMTQ